MLDVCVDFQVHRCHSNDIVLYVFRTQGLEMKVKSTASYMCQGDLNIQQDTGTK